jgi:hypothetical protein
MTVGPQILGRSSGEVERAKIGRYTRAHSRAGKRADERSEERGQWK